MTKTGGVGFEELQTIREALTEGEPEMVVWGSNDSKVWVQVLLKVEQGVKPGNGWMISNVRINNDGVVVVDMERGYSVYPDSKEERAVMAKKQRK